MRRRDFLRLGTGAALGLLAASCRRGARIPAEVPVAVREAAAEAAAGGFEPGLQVFPGGLELVGGRVQRLPLGLADAQGMSIEGGLARVWIAREDGRARAPAEATPKRYAKVTAAGDPRGFHVATTTMPPAGIADLLVAVEDAGRRLYGWTTVEIFAAPKAVDVGARAVAVQTPTTDDPRGVANVCTRRPACPLHTRTLAAVLTDARPTVYVVASPLLCTSRTCGPVLEEVLSLRERHGERVRFVHAEPYEKDTATTLAPAARAWRLPSEPWTFVIDASGVVRARFEGPVVAEEIDAALRALLEPGAS